MQVSRSKIWNIFMSPSVLWEVRAEDTSYSYFWSVFCSGSKRLIYWCYTHICKKATSIYHLLPQRYSWFHSCFSLNKVLINSTGSNRVSSLLEWTEPQFWGAPVKTLCRPKAWEILMAGQAGRALLCDPDMPDVCVAHCPKLTQRSWFSSHAVQDPSCQLHI